MDKIAFGTIEADLEGHNNLNAHKGYRNSKILLRSHHDPAGKGDTKHTSSVGLRLERTVSGMACTHTGNDSVSSIIVERPTVEEDANHRLAPMTKDAKKHCHTVA